MKEISFWAIWVLVVGFFSWQIIEVWIDEHQISLFIGSLIMAGGMVVAFIFFIALGVGLSALNDWHREQFNTRMKKRHGNVSRET